ncbi:PREDICTED: apoptosis-stimulating of p53 protein 2-like [Lepidothrix coronata]|uniref:Apoptosis-stimulating of p53 protein 2-like n=1 Tax=Lepidothrix coronata TaxID=321398 RepID=A0A6J0IYE7_9PASS|nr:PREDICTED: apoptosis-stimulating of p53 protein 2-like [Lepidothrix coronata]
MSLQQRAGEGRRNLLALLGCRNGGEPEWEARRHPWLRKKLKREQNARLQQQRECSKERSLEVAVLERRVSELPERLGKRKAALPQEENVPVSSDGNSPQPVASAPVEWQQ